MKDWKKWTLSKWIICLSINNIKRVIRQATDWAKVFVIDTTGKEQYKECPDQQE